tara:strand:+ start:1152 stop:1616 length:465 start_codon:yes stop_codon:yes gene_type:complete
MINKNILFCIIAFLLGCVFAKYSSNIEGMLGGDGLAESLDLSMSDLSDLRNRFEDGDAVGVAEAIFMNQNLTDEMAGKFANVHENLDPKRESIRPGEDHTWIHEAIKKYIPKGELDDMKNLFSEGTGFSLDHSVDNDDIMKHMKTSLFYANKWP